MPGRTFTLTGYVAERRKMHKRLFKASLKGIRKAAERSKTEVIRQIDATKPHKPVDRGKMRKGWKVGKTPDGAILTSTEPYTKYQEEGTKPFTANFGALLAWAKRKVRSGASINPKRGARTSVKGGGGKSGPSSTPSTHSPRSSKRGGFLSTRKGRARDADARALAGAAFFAIKKRGIKPKHFFRRASKKFSGFVDDEVARALRKVNS